MTDAPILPLGPQPDSVPTLREKLLLLMIGEDFELFGDDLFLPMPFMWKIQGIKT